MSITDIWDPVKIGKIRKIIQDREQDGWDEAWQKDVTPWDAGTLQPPLKDLIESKRVPLPTTGRALVPGCGKGYDAICIAQGLGIETIGSDVSETAVQAAEEYTKSLGVDAPVRYEVSDFFALKEQYDLVYDYTFFVAILPSRRPEWGQKMCEIVKPGGFLITLEFPLFPYHETGPPFWVQPEHYDEVLGDCWEKLIDEVPKISLESHVGKERIVVRRRK
ncbi:thiol methyltransferase 1 [Lentinus tigrinus ALCF2SS1-7]|uniref:Thiol methyltransferase 1 n=1 Tax=Lentinus tigrinus ALCF2SS1-6 TaxID=1328759 RepID=A0A5C2STQ5_9APHY|nr:thiol methyltransferase 1 [Lentinus tigrinus ALCF2SS1-6]RPD80972.1 thiol methyltransferase 1 [Lentinus tigrinus ALCF2SS1-7]